MAPLVSIILPCYNAQDYIREAVWSIIKQDYENLEIIAIDDYSKDNTYLLLEELASQDPRIRLYRNSINMQLIQTLNKGISLAKGKYIARMDADDISCSNRISTQVAYLERNLGIDMVSTCATSIDHSGRTLGPLNFHGCYDNVSASFVAIFDCPFLHPSILIKRNVLTLNSYPSYLEACHVEDYALWLDLIKANYKLEVIPQKLIRYRINSKGVSQSNSYHQFDRSLLLSAKYIEFIIGHSPKIPELTILRQGIGHLGYFNQLKDTLAYLREIQDCFLKKHLGSASAVEIAIRRWVGERSLRILWLAIVRSKLPVYDKLLVLVKLIPIYFFKGFHVGRLKNIYYHFLFMLRRRWFGMFN